jgi:pilus assembly protein FimV
MASRLRTRLRFSRLGMLILLVTGVGVIPGVSALGLGEIELDSALNERLLAEIPLVDLGDLQPDEIRVSLASAEDFARVGVERFYFLEDLQFEVAADRAGSGTIRVFSTRPITEPYLNFLVQLQWPQGRLLKEYTLLLDPPPFSEAPATAVLPATQSAPTVSNAGTVERSPAESEPMVVAPAETGSEYRPAPAEPAAATRASPDRLSGDSYGMTEHTDTLWSIATLARPSSAVSIQQTMLAIQRLNPDAFLDGNINRMKAGMNLTMPTEQQAAETSAADALQQVASQDRSWRGGEVAAQPAAPVERAAIDATPAQVSAAAPQSGEGRLKIVAGAGDSVSGDPQAAPPVDQAALSAALEERDRLSLEVADLTSALDREKELAASQLEVRDRQLAVKDKQIAEMQGELKQLREAGGTATANPRQDQSASTQSAWWQSPAVLGGGAGVLVLLLAGGLVAARRRGSPAGAEPVPDRVAPREPDAFRAPAPAAPAPVVEAAAVRSAPASTPDRVVAEPVERAPEPRPEQVVATGAVAGAAAGAVAAAETGGELVDVIGEADIYVAYGRYGQASALLQNALADDPNRHELRLKLLEIHAETGDQDSFERVRAELAERSGNPELLAAADALGASFAARDAADGAAIAGGSATSDQTAASDDLGFDLDLFDGTETSAARAEPTSRGTMDARDFGFDRPVAVPVDGATSASTAARATDAEALDELPVFDEPVEELAPLEFDLEVDELDAQSEIAGVLDEALRAPERGLLGGDRGIDFRLDEDDLDRLSEEQLAAEIDGEPATPEFEFADEADSASTKLDLARAYSEMGDPEGAREILLEVLSEGSVIQQQAAQELLQRL